MRLVSPKTRRAAFVLAMVAASLALSARPAAGKVARWRLDLENGAVFSGYNNIAVPGDTGTRFSLSRDFKTDPALFLSFAADLADLAPA